MASLHAQAMLQRPDLPQRESQPTRHPDITSHALWPTVDCHRPGQP